MGVNLQRIDWQEIRTEQEAAQAVLAAMRSVGLSGGAFSFTPISLLPSGNPGLLKRAIPLNIDQQVIDDWLQYQDELAGGSDTVLSQAKDPVRRRMITRILPERFVMEELLESRRVTKNTLGIKWIKALIGYGIRESYSIPVFTGRGEYWSLAAMRYFDNPETAELSHETLGELYWLTANLAEFCATKLNWRAHGHEATRRPLSPRELDCLYWAARGKTSAETAELLDLRTETVRKYLKNAAMKLNANNKTQAVCMAHQLGYLALV